MNICSAPGHGTRQSPPHLNWNQIYPAKSLPLPRRPRLTVAPSGRREFKSAAKYGAAVPHILDRLDRARIISEKVAVAHALSISAHILASQDRQANAEDPSNTNHCGGCLEIVWTFGDRMN